MKNLYLLSLFILPAYSSISLEQAILESNLEKIQQEVTYRLDNGKKLTHIECMKFLDLAQNMINKRKSIIEIRQLGPGGEHAPVTYKDVLALTWAIVNMVAMAGIQCADLQKERIPHWVYWALLASWIGDGYLFYKTIQNSTKFYEQQKQNYENALKIKQLIYDIS